MEQAQEAKVLAENERLAVDDSIVGIRTKLRELYFDEAKLLRGRPEEVLKGPLAETESATSLELVKLQRTMLTDRLRELLDEEEGQRLATSASTAEKLTRSSTRAAWGAAIAASLGLVAAGASVWLQFRAAQSPPTPVQCVTSAR
jgi:hypothetical protein